MNQPAPCSPQWTESRVLPTSAADSGALALGRATGAPNRRTPDSQVSVTFYQAHAAPPWAPPVLRQTLTGLLAKTPLPTAAANTTFRA